MSRPITKARVRLTSSVDASSTTISFTPVDTNRSLTSAAQSDFGTYGYLVINPSGKANNYQVVRFTGWSVSGTVITISGLTGMTNQGDDTSATLLEFAAGTIATISTNHHYFNHVVRDEDAQTIAGVKTFSALPATTAGNPVGNNDLARKAYVDAVAGGLATVDKITLAGTAGETVAAGNIVYFKAADGRWWKADADAAATSENLILGVAQGSGTAGNAISGGVLIQGRDTNQSGMTPGAIYYLSDTAGAISATPGTKEVTLGNANSATDLYFQPRYNQQLTEDEQDALAGSSGTPSTSNKFVTEADTRLFAPGIITPYGGFTAPSGWLLCDGSAVSRATYATLWSLTNPSLGAATITIATPGVVSNTAHGLVLDDKVYFTTTGALPTGLSVNTIYYVISAGLTADAFQLSATKGGSAINTSGSQSGVHTLYRSPYGLGDGSTTFNVPSLKGVVPVGRDSAQTEFNAVGETGGAKTHTLDTTEMPAHTHTINYNGVGGTGGTAIASGSGSGTVSGNYASGSTGGGGAHNNLQPYIALNYIIKT